MSKFKAGERVSDGRELATVVSDRACVVVYDGDNQEYTVDDRYLTLVGPAPHSHAAAILAAAEAWADCGSAENERALLRAVRASRGDAGHLSLAADFIALLVGLSVLAVAAVNGPWWLTILCAVLGIAGLVGFGGAADEHGATHEFEREGWASYHDAFAQPSHVRVLCDEGGCGLEEGHESGHLHDWETDGEKSA